MRILLFLNSLLLTGLIFGQDVTVRSITTLNDEVHETSGLLWIDGRLITHNDSGGEPHLYEIDTVDGSINRTVVIANAGNVDWEDICSDDEFIYIGDFGNNSGTRTNLCIYKISISDYLTTPDDTVYCDTITFNYVDQVDFTPATYTTNFDAEGLIATNDSLYLFTKNWGNYFTNIYSIPTLPGDYTIHKIDEINVEGLVTGADYDATKNEILLTGYTLVNPFLYLIRSVEENHFSEGEGSRHMPSFTGSIQIEGVAALGNHQFLVSSELQGADAQTLHWVEFYNFVTIPQVVSSTLIIYPTLVDDMVYLKGGKGNYKLELYNLNGMLVSTNIGQSLALNGFEAGVYVIRVYNMEGNLMLTEKIEKL